MRRLPTARVPGWLMLVAAMTAVGPVSIDMYLPGFPAIEREFNEQGIEGTMAAYLVGLALGQLFYGPLSDRFGRKPPLYVGFTLYAIGALGCALSVNMSMLMAMRVVQALGGGAGLAIGRAIIRDRCEPHEAARAFSTLMMIVALGPILAPVVGGMFVTVFGWRSTFVFQVLLGLTLLIAMHYVLTESRDPAHIRPIYLSQVLKTYLRLCADRAFVGYTSVGAFGFSGMFAYVAGAPTVLTERYALSPQQFGWLVGLNGLAFMTASRLNMVSLRTLTLREVLARYVWMPLLIGVVLWLAAVFFDLPLWLVVALQLSFFISVGRVNPNGAALAMAPHGRDAGAASAMMGALQSALSVVAGVSVAVFNDGTVRTLAAIMASAAALSALTFLWLRTES